MSQNTDILMHLKSGKTLTSLQALSLFNCMRLAARIENIRSMGHVIHTEIITNDNTNSRFAKYSMGLL